jgi:nitrile hydratase
LELGEKIQVRVHDSTADMRYIVVPAQPKESIGLSEKELKDWVTRDSMIGVGLPRSPI